MSITSKNISSKLIRAKKITAKIINVIQDKICRYFFVFNGDGEITTQRRWDPDAADPSFVLEFYNDTSIAVSAQFFKQGGNNEDLSFRVNPSGLTVYLGGSLWIVVGSADLGLGLWRIEYNSSAGTIDVYQDGEFINSKTGVSIGLARSPTAGIIISDGDIGVMANVKFYINGSTKETSDLVLDMPINDNSNAIKDYSPLALDGVLTAGTGSWNQVCEGDEDWVDSLAYNDGDPWID